MWPGSLNLRLPPKSGLWLPACQGGPTAGSKGGEVLCPMTLRGVRTQPRWNEAPCLEPGSPEGVGGCYPEEPGRQPCALSPVRPVSFQEGGQRPSVRRKRQPTTRHLRYSEFITSHQGTTHSTGHRRVFSSSLACPVFGTCLARKSFPDERSLASFPLGAELQTGPSYCGSIPVAPPPPPKVTGGSTRTGSRLCPTMLCVQPHSALRSPPQRLLPAAPRPG